jgi:ABC-2 type transport system permease protein
MPGVFETLGALALLVIVVLAWLIPHGRAALSFTEAEIAFLFPAPISRRALIHFKLLKSQTAILFTTLFLTLVTGRFGSGQNAWIHAAGWWIILSTLNLHFLGSSFARTLLLEKGVSNWKRRAVVLLLVALAAGAVYFWSRETMRAPGPRDLESVRGIGAYLQEVFASGPAPYLLFPFRMIVRPFLAPGLPVFVSAAWPALLLLLLHYAWVVRSDVSFEEGSLALSRRLAERVTALRKGNFEPIRKKASKPLFALHPTGSPVIALLWKNLIAMGNMFNIRMLLVIFAILTPSAIAALQVQGQGAGTLFGMLAGILAIWSIFLGPQMLRQDLRQDLPNADILKLFPLPGWQVVLGELLSPVIVLTIIQWFLVFMFALLFQGFPPGHSLGWAERIVIGLSACLLLPLLNFISIAIPNAAVLLYPGWFQAGKEGIHGIEATGQRIIFVLGQMVAFVVVLLPAAIGFALGYIPIAAFIHPVAAIPAGAVGAAVALAAESALALLLLGKWFDKLDVSSEPQV